MEQRSDEWYKFKIGKVGASRVGDIMSKGRSGAPSSTRKNYMTELLIARLTGEYPESFESDAMRWGTETEPRAREWYKIMSGNEVYEVGFIEHPTIPMFGCSPDGLIGADGGLEIKCPNTATHIETLEGAEIKLQYQYQIQTSLCVTGREWWDFVSYDPRLPGQLQGKIIKCYRDEKMIVDIKCAVILFLEELADLEKRMRSMM